MQQFLFEQLPKPHQGLIGHRGAAALAPENTLESLKAAATCGLNWVEFDVQPCASGEWVVFHDADLYRTTGAPGKIQKKTWSELKNLDAGSWFGSNYQGARIPLLGEVLCALQQLALHPVIEIKTFGSPQKQSLISLLRCVQSTWPATLPPPLFSSFDLQTLILLRSLDPSALIGYLVSELNIQAIALSKQYAFSSLHAHAPSLTPFLIQHAKQQDLPLLVYTLNDPIAIASLLAQGVFAVFSDLTFLK